MYKNGIYDNNPCQHLKDFSWDNMVTFYFGCSFTFESSLNRAKVPQRNLEQGKNISMYTTNVQCVNVGPFACPMVVSMRPIPRDMLETAVRTTVQLDFAHGAPIHIGNPSHIGIENVKEAHFGESVVFQDGDVPAFWACGVTCNVAVKSASKYAHSMLHILAGKAKAGHRFCFRRNVDEEAAFELLRILYLMKHLR